MSEVIILQHVRDLRIRIEEELEYYNHLLDKCEARMYILREEHRQLVELINILEQEKEKG